MVGSGPNGLAAAIRLAQAGRSVVVYEAAETIGGGMRSLELIEPGTVHDVCSAIHPFGVGSPFLKTLPLADFGLKWIEPPILAAHPLDDAPSGLLFRDLATTMDRLGVDGAAWDRLIGWPSGHIEDLLAEVYRPLPHLPRSPLVLARFGIAALLPAEVAARRFFDTPTAQALWAGMAAHTIAPLTSPLTSAAAILLTAVGHQVGWPLPEGGSQSIADAMAGYLRSLGGEIRTGVHVKDLAEITDSGELSPGSPVLFDTSPRGLADICGDALPVKFSDRLRAWKHGPGVFKVDFICSEAVPWSDPEVAKAGTVHVGGTLEECAESEADAWAGRVSDRPFILTSEPTRFDPTRSSAGHTVLWAYCHAPHGSTVDMTEQIEAQIERFAPGFRDTVVARHTMHAMDYQAHNPNLIGGDIAGGASRPLALMTRPRIAVNPYGTPNDQVFLCSASTSPGAGVHGMCGYWAAEAALGKT